MDYSSPDAFTLPLQLTKQVRRDVYQLLEPTQPELSAKGKTVLITGVSGGIGKVIAESWATAGASGIVITGRNVEVLGRIAAQLRSLAPSGTKVLDQAADITDEASVAALFVAARKVVGKVDVLVHSAGSLEEGLVGTTDATKFFADFRINVLGSYLLIQHFLAQADGTGTMVSFTTGAISSVFPGMESYTASKLALARLMENLHAEQPNLRVFVLIPGIVQTGMTVDAMKPYAKDSPGLSAGWTLFLSTPHAEWMRGGIVSVNCESAFQCSTFVTVITRDRIKRGYRGNEAHKDEIIRDKLLQSAFLNANLGNDGHPWT